jgi:hypothetical protein
MDRGGILQLEAETANAVRLQGEITECATSAQ